MFDFLIRSFRCRYGSDRSYYGAINNLFGFAPDNIELYKLALIHKSASLILEDGTQINNERLEFLGDAIIEAVTSDYLFVELPHSNEGALTQLRSKIVSRQSLNAIAKKIGLHQYIVSHSSGNVTQKHIYGDAFEAMIGAIYLDKGYDFVNRLLINQLYGRFLDLNELIESETDFKSRLIEWGQKSHRRIVFSTAESKEPGVRTPKFSSTVLIDGIESGMGVGESKKEAEQMASKSVSREITDEVCADFLDRADQLLDQAVQSAKQKEANGAVER